MCKIKNVSLECQYAKNSSWARVLISFLKPAIECLLLVLHSGRLFQIQAALQANDRCPV